VERGESPQAELGTLGLFRGSGFAACNCLLRHATMPLRSSLRCCLTRLARCPSWRSSSRWSRIYLAHVSRNEAPAQNPSRNSRIYDMPQRSSLRCCLIRLAKCLFWRSSSKWFKICLAHASRKGAPAWLAGQASGHRSQVTGHAAQYLLVKKVCLESDRCGAARHGLQDAHGPLSGADAPNGSMYTWRMLPATDPLHRALASK